MTWHRDGVKLRASRRCILTLDREGFVILEVKGATLIDAGLYTCTARNEVGETKTSTRVIVVPTADRDGTVGSGGVCEIPLVATNQ